MIKKELIPTLVFDTSIIKKNTPAILYTRTNINNDWTEKLYGTITKINKHSLTFVSNKYKTDLELVPEDLNLNSHYKLELINIRRRYYG